MNASLTPGPAVNVATYFVRYFQCNRFGYLKPMQLCNYYQENAVEHAIEIGCGLPWLARKNLTWVLSHLKFHMNRWPKHHEEIVVTTWPSGTQRLFALREFKLTTPAGEVLGYATSYWLMIDLVKFRPQRLIDVLDMPFPEPYAPSYFPTLEKLPRREDCAESMVIPVLDSWIDTNMHMNNAQYTGAFTDWLYRKIGRNFFIRDMQISYLSAVTDHDPDPNLTVQGIALDAQTYAIEALSGGVLRAQTRVSLMDVDA